MSAKIEISRRFALRLHALDASDRTWILSQLDDDTRARLEPMLKELDSLGFCIDQAMLESLADNVPGTKSQADTFHRNIAFLDTVPANWILGTLKEEPRALRNCIENIHQWTWSSESTSAANRNSPPTHFGEPRSRPTPRVQQALIAALVRRFESTPRKFNEATPGPRSFRTPDPATTSTVRGILRWLPWKR